MQHNEARHLMVASEPDGLAELARWAEAIDNYERLRWPIGNGPGKTGA